MSERGDSHLERGPESKVDGLGPTPAQKQNKTKHVGDVRIFQLVVQSLFC